MKNIVNIEFARKRFDKVKSYYAPKGLAPQLSQLRIETDIVDGQGTYEFDLKKENLSVVENGLKRNDLFVCLGIPRDFHLPHIPAPTANSRHSPS